jgi:hypothetical protein
LIITNNFPQSFAPHPELSKYYHKTLVDQSLKTILHDCSCDFGPFAKIWPLVVRHIPILNSCSKVQSSEFNFFHYPDEPNTDNFSDHHLHKQEMA